MKVGRNAPCPCGSGKKYKHCCLNKTGAPSRRMKLIYAGIVLLVIGAAVAVAITVRDYRPQPNRVWSEEHQHWHTVP